MNQSSEPGFARVLSVRDGLAVTVGMVIGAGILRAPGEIAGLLGDPWFILAVWILGGIVAGLSTLLLAEMSAALPQAGGKYVYAREAWGPVMGFVSGWSELLVGRGFSGAAKAVVIAEYIRILTGGKGSIPVIAGAVVLAFFFVHTQGIKASTVFQNVTTVIKIFVVLIIAGAGIWAGDLLSIGARGSNGVDILNQGWVSSFSAAYLAVAFAYYGWEDVSKMAEEIKDPGKALPSILLKGVLFARSSRLIPDKANLGFRFPCDGPGRGGTCQVSSWDHVFLGLFWMYNGLSVVIFHFSWKMQSDVWGLTGGNFAQSSITINGWLRDFLWAQSSQVLTSYGQPISMYGLMFLGAHFVWAFSLMFLFSGRGYWQELFESIIWAHNKLKLAPTIQPRALSITQGRAVGAAHFLLGGIATTGAFFHARLIGLG